MGFAQDNRSPILKRLSGIVSGLGAGQTAVIKIPPGATYKDLVLQCTIAGTGATRAEIETMLTQWRLTISGVEQWTLTGKQMLAIIAFYSSALVDDSGIVTIPFERLWMDSLAAKVGPQDGTLGESSVQLEITQAGGSTIDLISVWGVIDPVAQPLGPHIMIKRLTPNISSTGEFIFEGLYKRPGDVMYALHLEVPVVANLTNIVYEADNIRLYDAAPAIINQGYKRATPNRTVQTAKLFVHLDFASRNMDQDGIPLNMSTQELRLTFANAAPGQVNILQEIGTQMPTQGGVVAGGK